MLSKTYIFKYTSMTEQHVSTLLKPNILLIILSLSHSRRLVLSIAVELVACPSITVAFFYMLLLVTSTGSRDIIFDFIVCYCYSQV